MYRRYVLLLSFCMTVTALSAQVNSPYSRYGLGNLFPATFGAANGMGGLSAAFITPININYLNPASYAEFIGATFDVGVSGSVVTLRSDLETFTSGNANLSNIAFGFPILKNARRQKMGLSFGLIPYSSFQYNILDQQLTDDADLGIKEYNYVGDGNLYQLYGGLGYKFQTDTTQHFRDPATRKDTVIAAHIFSIGANSAYLFGSLYSVTYASFPDLVNAQTTKLTRDNSVDGGLYNAGIAYQRQYTRKDGPNRNNLIWKFGVSASPELTVQGNQSVLWTNILKNGNYEFVTDTIYNAPDTSGNITLPLSWRAGATFSFFSSDKEKNQFTIGAQFEASQWSAYRGFQDAGNLGDSWRITLGTEIIPKLKKDTRPVLTYRLGAYTGMSQYLDTEGNSLSDLGLNLGFAMPLGLGNNAPATLRNSRLNIWLNVGQRGAGTDLSETYYNFGLSFSLVDMGWFIKYKLN